MYSAMRCIHRSGGSRSFRMTFARITQPTAIKRDMAPVAKSNRPPTTSAFGIGSASSFELAHEPLCVDHAHRGYPSISQKQRRQDVGDVDYFSQRGCPIRRKEGPSKEDADSLLGAGFLVEEGADQPAYKSGNEVW